jgi:hypothetical protein
MQVARLRGVAKDFGPAGFFELGFGSDGFENFLQLAIDFGVREGLVEEAGDDIFRLSIVVSIIHQSAVR